MMSPSDHSAGSTESHASATTTPKQISPQTLARRLFRLDMVLLALVLVLAVFLGMFTANNTDLLLHLSLGSPFGDDSQWVHHAWLSSLVLGAIYEPFSPDFHGSRHAIMVKALIVVLMTLTLVLIRRRTAAAQGKRGDWIVPITFAALALVVASPRLLLQPLVISLLLLALTLWVLTLPAALHPRAIWVLPVLFAVWVNMDEWFVLGPLTVLLWWIGAWIQQRSGIAVAGCEDLTRPRLKELAKVLGVGVAACLLNPWFYRAFVLPADLAHFVRYVMPPGMTAAGRMIGSAQEGDPQFLRMISPLSSDYLTRNTLGLNTAGMAYFVLLVLGIISFVLPVFYLRPEGEGEGGPVYVRRVNISLLGIFLAFMVLSFSSWRMIPFFAVTAGPIAALNFQDFLRRKGAEADKVTGAGFNIAIGSRIVALLGCVALLACAWPGWLHGNPGDWRVTHHVSWNIAEDPGVSEAARVIREVQKQTGLCKLGFSYSPEGGNQFLWPAHHGEPTVHVMVDARLALYTEQAVTYGKIRKALRDEYEIIFGTPPKTVEDQQFGQKRINDAREVYQTLLRQSGIDYVVVARLQYDPQAQRLTAYMQDDPWRQWVPLYHDGRTAVFAWIDPAHKERDDVYRKYRLDVYRLASSTSMPPNVPRIALEAAKAPPPPIDVSDDWNQYLFGPQRPGLAALQAEQYIEIFNLAARDWGRSWPRANMEMMVGGVGGAGAAALGVTAKPLVITRKDQQGKTTDEQFFKGRDLGPPAALFLAVRAARNANQQNPNDASGYGSLGGAYRLLWAQDDYYAHQLHVGFVAWPKPPLRHQFRLAQILHAFQQGVSADSTKVRLHANLHDVYRGMGFHDLALEHLLQVKAELDSQKPAAKENNIDQEIKVLTEEVRRRTEQFKTRTGTTTTDVVEKFDLALRDPDQKDAQGRPQAVQRGTIKLALQILLDAKPESYQNDQNKARYVESWKFYLLLMTGQAREVHDVLNSNEDLGKALRNLLGGGEYEQMRAMTAAAIGDYAAADKFLDEAEKARGLPSDEQILKEQEKHVQRLIRQRTASAGWLAGGNGFADLAARFGAAIQVEVEIIRTLIGPEQARRDVAELRLIRGLLALEAGDSKAATQHFRDCLNVLPPFQSAGLMFTDRPIALRYLELLDAK